jgi:hypothetical protein
MQSRAVNHSLVTEVLAFTIAAQITFPGSPFRKARSSFVVSGIPGSAPNTRMIAGGDLKPG